MRVLVVEDNERLVKNLTEFLRLEGYAVDVCRDGNLALSKALTSDYDVIVLDINLPGMDGLEVCKNLRTKNNQTPVLMLTSNSEIDDKISGLDIGADDYMTKPFSLEELASRLKALIRRSCRISDTALKIGNIEINLNNKTVIKEGENVNLSPKEYAVFEYLLYHRGDTKNRTQILDHVWGDSGDDLDFSSDTVEVHISYLRQKLGKELIVTRRGFGYLIE